MVTLDNAIILKSMDFSNNSYYSKIDEGSEGKVYRYKEKIDGKEIAIKIFGGYYERNPNILQQKIKKIEHLSTYQDNSFSFPIGFVLSTQMKIIGYYMKLIKNKIKNNTFDCLYHVQDKNVLLECLKNVDSALQRIHLLKIIVGDIKTDNILLGRNNTPVLTDTDNYCTGNYGYDTLPRLVNLYSNLFKVNHQSKDIDKIIFTKMVLQFFIKTLSLDAHPNLDFFKDLINYLELDDYSKEILREIFSDSVDKPYITEVLKNIDPTQELISKKHKLELIKRYRCIY